jgi:hypothetical protein
MTKTATNNSHHSADTGYTHHPELLSFTIDPSTGRIVKLEGLTADGVRRALTDDEKDRLVKRRTEQTIERVVERAFEAGITCLIDGEAIDEEANESAEDVDLTHRLLAPLFEHSAARRLITRDVVDRTLLDTLIERSVKSSPAGEKTAADLR